MKRVLIITALLLMVSGCNYNESKEARIQNLESQNERTATKLKQLEDRIQSLESKLSTND